LFEGNVEDISLLTDHWHVDEWHLMLLSHAWLLCIDWNILLTIKYQSKASDSEVSVHSLLSVDDGILVQVNSCSIIRQLSPLTCDRFEGGGERYWRSNWWSVL